jgi:hypothetical protein
VISASVSLDKMMSLTSPEKRSGRKVLRAAVIIQINLPPVALGLDLPASIPSDHLKRK